MAMNQGASPHENFSTRFAFLMATIGAAVGLGNIWKFPYSLGNSGGSAFVIIYLVAIFIVATPIMMSEMIIGRRGRLSAPGSMNALAEECGSRLPWGWVGWWGIIGMFFVLSFFSVVAGWALAYVVKVGSGTFTGLSIAEVGQEFDAFLHSPLQVTAWHFAFMAITVFVVSRGIKAGIEKVVNYLMPALFVMMIGLVVYAYFVGDFTQAVQYLFSPDFSKITPAVALAAIGQAFFSVNVGVGAIVTYSAYLPANVNLPRSAMIIAIGDTAVALLAGLVIFPIVFANGLDPAGGPGLLFVTLSAAFGQMPGGAVVGAVFFLLIFVAALTSSLSMLEVIISRAEETKGLKRKPMAVLVGAVAFILGLATVFSFNIWESVRPLGFLNAFQDDTPFNLVDKFVTNLVLPIGGMLYAIFAGWWLSKETTMTELGLSEGLGFQTWRFLTRYVAPVAVGLVFVTNLW